MPNQFEVETKILKNGKIEHHTKDLLDRTIVEMMDTKEKHTREALIILGWVPPESKTAPEVPLSWGDINGRKRHFITQISDDRETLVTSKWWNKGKQRWEYVTEELWLVKNTIRLFE